MPHNVLIYKGLRLSKFEAENLQTANLTPEERLGLALATFNPSTGKRLKVKVGEVIKAMVEVAVKLEAYGVKYAIVGHAAAILYGKPIATSDIDLLVKYDAATASTLAKAAREAGFNLSVSDLIQALTNQAYATAILRRFPPFRLDVIPLKSKLEEEELSRVNVVTVMGKQVKVAPLEFLIPFLALYERIDAAAFLIDKYWKGLDKELLESVARRLKVLRRTRALLRKVKHTRSV